MTVYVVTGLTGAFKIYNAASGANEPNLKLNSKMFVSNLKTYNSGDFVAYKLADVDGVIGIRTHRLCGKSNDVLEIVNGVVFLNGKNFDANINLVHIYETTQETYFKIKAAENISDDLLFFQRPNDVVTAFLTDEIAKKYGLTANRIIEEKGNQASYTNEFPKEWNKDNFGPIKIPYGKIFVLGDNRDDSEDSRYFGFIDEKDIVGTVL